MAGNAEVTLNEGDLASTLTELATIDAMNIAAPLVQDAQKLSLTLDTAIGLIRGSFVDPVSRRATPFFGAMLQGAATGRGFFVSSGSSGLVTLQANPAFGDESPGGGLEGGEIPPVVTIKSPADGAKLSGADPITFSGSASDKVSVGTVEYQVLFGGQISQEMTANGTTTWSFSLAPGGVGSYTVYVKAVDVNGNESTIVSRSIDVTP